jgi:hypothetical protein
MRNMPKSVLISFLLLLGLSLLLPTCVECALKTPSIEWQQSFNGSLGYSVVQTEDGGYTITGLNGTHSILIKTDSTGNLLWAKKIEMDSETNLPFLVKTTDSGYALGGTVDNSYVLIKVNSSGDLQWNKTYVYEAPFNSFRALTQTNDEGYAFVGTFSPPQNASHAVGHIWFVKTDALGNIQWNRTIIGKQGDFANSLIQLVNGKYVIFGTSWESDALPSAFKIIETDAYGVEEWNMTFGGSGKFFTAESSSGTLTNDGGFLLAGVSVEKGSDWLAWLVKTDDHGNMEWNRNYGEVGSWALAAVQAQDGGYAFAGLHNGEEVWLVKTDVFGTIEWDIVFGGAAIWGSSIEDFGKCLIQAGDGGFVLVGAKESHIWLVKTTPERSSSFFSLEVTLLIAFGAVVIVSVIFLFRRARKAKTAKLGTLLHLRF